MRAGLWLAASTAVVAACAVGHVAGDDTVAEGGSSEGGKDASVSDAKPTGDAGSDASTCTAPMTVCADAGCVDTTTNPSHCGACATECATADAGALVANDNGNPDAGIPNFGVDAGAPWSVGTASCAKSACGVDCPQGLTLCGDGICYDTANFHEHCGDCNTACAAGEYCAGGHCCASGSEYCSGVCTDVLANAANCGACGKACNGGESCVAGACVACTNSNYAPSATATSSGGGVTTYGPQNANDGKLEINACTPYSWLNTSAGSTTEWLQLTWTTSHTLKSIHVDTTASTNDSCTLSSQTATGAQVQWWNGTTWVTDGTVSGKTDDWDYTFTTQVTTTKIRLYSVRSKANYNAFIFELQAYGCN